MSNDIFNSRLAELRAQRQARVAPAQATQDKTSSAARPAGEEVYARGVKVSELRAMGTTLMALGLRGFHKTAMSEVDPPAQDLSGGVDAGPTDKPAEPPQPTLYTPNLVNEGPPETLSGSPGNAAGPAGSADGPAVVTPAETTSPESAPVPEGVKSSRLDPARCAAVLRKMVGGRYVDEQTTKVSAAGYLQRLGLRGSVDAFNVFVKTAAHRNTPVAQFVESLWLHDPTAMQEYRTAAMYANNKTSEELGNEVATAKSAVEAAVKAKGQLPEATAIAQAVNVSPMAADIAIHETAELIAATGGQVGNAISPLAGAVPPAMGAVGMPAPAAGAVATPPMMTDPMASAPMASAPMAAPAVPTTNAAAPPMAAPTAPPAAPPMDPAAMAAPPADGGGGGGAAEEEKTSQAARALASDPLRMLAALADLTKVSDDTAAMPTDKETGTPPANAAVPTAPVQPEADINTTLKRFLASDDAAFSATPNQVADVNDGSALLSQFKTPLTRQDAGGVSGGTLTSDLAGNPTSSGGTPAKQSTADPGVLNQVIRTLQATFPAY